MSVFEFRFQVSAPVDVVSEFHFQRGILKKLSPPLMYMQVHRFDPLADGSIGDFTMWMGPFPVHWTAQHQNVSSTSFTDVQIHGPMKSWQHTHTFRAIDEQRCEVHEHIEFEHDSGLRGLWSRLLFPQPALFLLFCWRAFVTRRACAALLRSRQS